MWECVGPVWAFNSCWLANLCVGELSWVVLVRECWQQPELGVPFLGGRYGRNGDSRKPLSLPGPQGRGLQFDVLSMWVLFCDFRELGVLVGPFLLAEWH